MTGPGPQPALASTPQPLRRRDGLRLQRQCDCGSHVSGGGECAACKKKRLQRKGLGTGLPVQGLGAVDAVLGRPGQPLDASTRSFLEPRFGQDFSRVRVHADEAAAASARSLGAQAYTVGRHVVFGSSQFRPRTKPGLELLSHELAHVVQQGFAAPVASGELELGEPQDAAEREADAVATQVLERPVHTAAVVLAPVLRRKVAKDFPTIKDNLTYGLFDWAITDAEAHQVLTILLALSEVDLVDTVAAMDREGLTARFLDQLPEKDTKTNEAFLHKVAHLRSWTEKGKDGKTTTRKGSCDPKQAGVVEAAHTLGRTWLDQAIQKMAALRAAPKDPGQKTTLETLNRHFNSTEPKVIDYAHGILQDIRADFEKWDLIQLDCFGEWDPSCHAAGAYANGGSHPSVVFCASYFDDDAKGQARTLVHEIAHIQPGMAHITDRAYRSDRLIKQLRPEEAMTNADSYALLVRELATGDNVSNPVVDAFQDCPEGWKKLLEADAARVQRANRNTQVWFTQFTSANAATYLNAQERGWLGGTDDKTLEKAQTTYDAAESKFKESITFECEPEGGGRCDGGNLFYWYALGDLHVCPAWAKLGDQEREIALLSGFYGYIGEGDNATRRRQLAQVATSVSSRIWAAPAVGQVLAGSAAWTTDMIEIQVVPVQPAIPGRSSYYENGFLHQKMSAELPVYQGASCGTASLPFRQRLVFQVDDAKDARPQPFLPPQLKAEYAFTTAQGVQTWSYGDRRPIYEGPGAPLSHQLPSPIDLPLAKNGTLHSRIVLEDPTAGLSRVYEDDLGVKPDPCPKVASAKDPRPAILPADQAFAKQLTELVADVHTKIDALLLNPPPKDDVWATPANSNVAAVTGLLDSLEWDLETDGILLRFDQPAGTKANAHYDVLKDEMHLKPPAAVDPAAEVVDLVHEYTHQRQDKAAEAKLIDQKAPAVFDKGVDLQQEIEARREETYFTRLLQLAGVKFGPKADILNIELTARTFVREFEEERTGNAKTRKAATQSIRKEIGGAYEQQFKDNGTFGEYPLEVSADGRVLLYASWKKGVPPVDLGALPDAVQSLAQLESHLHRALVGSPALPGLFRGPKKQAYDRAIFTVFFRKRTLLQFGIAKP